jgi:Permease MlaE
MVRELAPLITATIVAGRTGSAYTAQTGTMKITEEVDALRAIGITPMDLIGRAKGARPDGGVAVADRIRGYPRHLGRHDPGQSGAGYIAYVAQGCANILQRHKSLRNKEAGKSHFPGSWLKKPWTDFFNIL